MTARRLVLLIVPIAAFLAAAGVAVVALNGVGGAVACAVPPRGYHPPSITARRLYELVVPALVVLLVGEYFALAPQRRWVRVVASSLVLLVSLGVFAYVGMFVSDGPCA